MINKINNKWNINIIKDKIKVLKDNEIYRIGDVLCINNKNSAIVKEIMSNEIYKDKLLYQYFNNESKDFYDILIKNKNKIDKYFDDNYIVMHIRLGDDLNGRCLTESNKKKFLDKLKQFDLNKKVIIITAMHYGHNSNSSKFYSGKSYCFNDKSYNENIFNVHKLISDMDHELEDIISNDNIDLDYLNLVFCENLVALDTAGGFAKSVIKFNKKYKNKN
tara:strand:+ start:341 stop:997 length:657 start_codon:yes stop_codon:yes gene_type:complete